MKRTNVYIDSTANVSDEAEIGEGTKVWINSQIRENVQIGKNCIISKDTYIDFSVWIGDNVKIQNGVSVYHGVTIQDDVFIGPNAAFTNDFYPRAFNSDFEVKKTVVENGASVGANATIVCGNTLGEYCMVGSGSVVTHDVPPFALIVGNPARQIGRVCKCGKKLAEGESTCKSCGFVLPENK
jgi:UDP-2-acetamido-3-amino-2,3-dideoxy-glucuronate N-acetyltransferase